MTSLKQKKHALYILIFSICIFLSALLLALSASAAESESTVVASGACGGIVNPDSPYPYHYSVNWTLSDDGTLRISGNGKMADYIFSVTTQISSPWFDMRDQIEAIIVDEGVTSIGDYAFRECKSLTSVAIPKSVTSIGEGAFSGCTGLTGVYISDIGAWCGVSFGNLFANPCLYAKGLYLNEELVTDLVIPDGVTSIGAYAFDNCTSLTSVTIPKSVASVGADAFSGCTGLTGVYISDISAWCGVNFGNRFANPWFNANRLYLNEAPATDLAIPEGVTAIKSWAFASNGLSSITIPESATSIGPHAFNGLTSAGPIGSGCGYEFGWTKKIPDYAFYGCSNLTSVTIPEGVTSIGSSAFSNCTDLTSVTIPEGVTSIGSSAFSNCTGLTSVTIPEGVTSIGSSAFSNCTSLTSVTIPEGVTSIGNSAFHSCASLTSVTIPSSVTTISNSAFEDCGLASVTILEGVTSVGNSAFYNCTSLTNVTIPKSVTTIEGGAFSQCFNLQYVNYMGFPTDWGNISIKGGNDCLTDAIWNYFCKITLKTVGGGIASVSSTSCFVGTSVSVVATADDGYILKRILLDGQPLEGTTFIVSGDHIVTVVFETEDGGPASGTCGDDLTWTLDNDGTLRITGTGAMGDYSYKSHSPWYGYRNHIQRVELEDGVTSVGNYAFDGCSGLTSVTIPDGVVSIGDYAFLNCGLTSVTIPDSVTSISEGAFFGCTHLTSITIPGSVTAIGSDAFCNCTSLASVTISEGVTSIGGCAFDSCTSLTSVTIPESVTSIEWSAFQYCTSLTSITIPGSVTSMEDEIFEGCTGLTSAGPIGSGCNIEFGWMTSIPEYAFYRSELTSITIPGSVTSIGGNAFSNCANLEQVIYAGTASQLENISGKEHLMNTGNASTQISCMYVEASFDSNGGMGSMDNEVLLNGSAYTLPHCAFTAPQGMRFLAWSIDGQVYQPYDQIALTKDTTVTAVWKVTNSVVFDANGGTGTMDGVSVFEGDAYTLPECAFTAPIHKRFSAWCIDSQVYQPGEQIVVTKNTTITAVWDDVPIFLVSFDANGGTGAMDSVIIFEGDTCTLPECTFIAPGREHFLAWGIDGQVYQPGERIVVSKNTTVKAVWDDVSIFLVSFDANGGAGTMDSIAVFEGDTFILPECAFAAPAKKRFIAWHIEDKVYRPGEQIAVNASMSISAMWEDVPLACETQPLDGTFRLILAPGQFSGPGVMMLATYSADGRMNDLRMVTIPEMAEGYASTITVETVLGGSYKLFLLNGNSFAPLFDALSGNVAALS